MTKAEFKSRWESDSHGGGITFEDVAKCAAEWGILNQPRALWEHRILEVVLDAAGVCEEEGEPCQPD